MKTITLKIICKDADEPFAIEELNRLLEFSWFNELYVPEFSSEDSTEEEEKDAQIYFLGEDGDE